MSHLPIQLIIVDVVSRAISSVVVTPIDVPISLSSIFVAILISVSRVTICAVISVIFFVIRTIAHIAISAASLIPVVIGSIFRPSVYSRISIMHGVPVQIAIRSALVIPLTLSMYVARSGPCVSVWGLRGIPRCRICQWGSRTHWVRGIYDLRWQWWRWCSSRYVQVPQGDFPVLQGFL